MPNRLAQFAANRWAARGAAALAGLAAAFANQPWGFLPGLLGYAGLLWICDNAEPTHPRRSAFFRGWLAGLAYFVVSIWWIGEAFFVDAKEQGWMAPFAVAFVAAGLALFWGAAAALYRLVAPTNAARVLVFAGALALLEWLRGHLLTGFPWDLPGEVWEAGSAPSQAASAVGVYGLTWVTLAIAAAPGLGWRGRGARIAIGAAALGLVALYGIGAWRLAKAVTTPTPGAPLVRIVQPNTPELPAYDAGAFARILQRNLALTVAPASRAPDIVIWSEAGLPDALNDYLAPGTWTAEAIAAALRPGQTLITGGYRFEPAPPGAFAPDGNLYFNSLAVVQRSGPGIAVVALYDKHRLTPFGEYLPLARIAEAIGLRQLVHVGQGFTPGPPPRPLAPPGVPAFQPLICYESLFPGFTRRGARLAGRRAAWIVNISDDAWFGVTSGPWQHLNLASYRAIEEGLPMLRGTPTGVSAAIDAYGRILPGKLLGQGVYGNIDVVLPPALKPTPFDQWGDIPFALLLALSGALMFQNRNATLRRNGNGRPSL
ncbi:MAG TPA: apolipoprotein N-acyltransferase [Caulobacteraceae bacterium]|nr:apolipoprotein N-acyltransferase [Caulobacteraceae bacterium]